ncbi:hypothetical protein [Hydrogenophaga sp.]|uniref:hypothetical protein n=1 Tax=Hydrogenophaga sp. TaxID=1904254 RepID=UPI001ACAB138|nr:hypothetical protein [Hydrogenophaga sp.]MBN9369451.1 hypothetical protein [Hydrogenophaga sp.]
MMTSVSAYPSRPRWLSRGMRLGVLLVILLGTLLSALGNLQSHGIQTLGVFQHAESAALDDSHGHSHEDESLALFDGLSHTHLGADHSHDKAHALPVMPDVIPAMEALRKPAMLAWMDRLTSRRLERPPKAA